MNKSNRQISVERVTPDETFGLTDKQVNARVAAGLTNTVKNYNSKSYGKIIFDNVCTFYNLLCLAGFIALLSVHTANTPLSNYAFIIIYLLNIGIGIIQEVRAKKTLEKLSLAATPTVTVVRNGIEKEIRVSDIVADDVIILTLGMQIPADCVILSGYASVDESILTGESIPVMKAAGDKLLGGSFVTSGKVVAKAEHVGEKSYSQTLLKKAKKFKKTDSELLNTMKHIINVIGLLIVPISVLSGIINYNHLSSQFEGSMLVAETVKRTTAVAVGMIPGGMFLLTTVALAVGVIRLSRHHTLVQDMYSLEMLARVNLLCLDKTGTITDGNLKVVNTYELQKCPYSTVIANMERILGDKNATAEALKKHFESETRLVAAATLPFNSQRKYSAVTFENGVTYILGAPEKIVTCPADNVKSIIKENASAGRRVLLLARTDKAIENESIDLEGAEPALIIVLEDNVRPEAVETIKWFKENGVGVKVISGDDHETVSHISAVAGVENADKSVSLAGMTDEEVVAAAEKYTVFGRVTPEQKALLIKTFKSSGACVAMTGDGVNDILAMKEADCSITFASGNSSTRSLAHVVLMTNDFNCMPQVVKEGRRVINNVERSSALYLMKTAFIVILALASIIMGVPYPLTTGDILALESIIIGLSSIALSVQPNKSLVKGKFLNTVFANALPGTFILLLDVFVAQNAYRLGICDFGIVKTVTVLAMTFGGLSFLIVLCMPFNKYRAVLVGFITALLVVWALLLTGSPLFRLPPVNISENVGLIIFLTVLFIIDIPTVYGVKKLFKFILSVDKKRR